MVIVAAGEVLVVDAVHDELLGSAQWSAVNQRGVTWGVTV